MEKRVSKTKFVAEPGRLDVIMTRTFEASRERVFDAYVDPKAIPQWWGPRFLTTTVDKLDARHGGLWRFVQKDKAGNEYGFRGVFHESRGPERIVRTFEFEAMPEHVMLETVTFEDVGGKTKVTACSVFQTQEARDGMLQSGAEQGAADTWDRLEELLKS